jgi:LacI family transcriptional regulator
MQAIIQSEELVILSDERGEKCGYESALTLLSLADRPTAIVAGYDTIALGAYRALSEQGVRIPEDIALVGFDDSDFCRYLPTSMTSVNYDVAAECRVAVAILLGRIREGDSHAIQTVAIVPTLIVRESTASVVL